jgi:RNA polymerase sigma-70 factor (ECF subfamily)
MSSSDEFSEQYSKHIDEIYRYVFFAVGQHQQIAEDLTSSIFLKAFKRRKQFDPAKASFRTFIFRVARNAVIDHYRTRKTAEEIQENSAQTAFSNADIDASLLWNGAREQLSDHAYEAMILRYRVDMPIKEIAVTLELTQDAVKSLLKRSKQQLRKSFTL